MLALTLQDGKLRLRHDYPRPTPGPGEALLRMRYAGICGTDLALTAGYKGGFSGVLGHEYVAEVVEAPGNEEWVGKRVVGEINTFCGECDHCRRGLITHCQNRRVLGIINWDGAFAEYLVSPVYLLHPVPANVSDEMAVFVEPLAAAYAALRDTPEDAGDRVIIFGDGRLGQLIARVFQSEGYHPLLIGRHNKKLALAAQAGVRTALAPPAGQEYDIAVDVTGNAQAIQQIFGVLRPRGALILKTTSAHPSTLDFSPVVVNELRIIGSRCGPFPRAIQALSQGVIDPRPLITERYPLERAEEAFERARQRESLKILLYNSHNASL
jgi:2-desacetyl-2-hydroxyethyl bacteriochlorophyllide A dehydrogenase